MQFWFALSDLFRFLKLYLPSLLFEKKMKGSVTFIWVMSFVVKGSRKILRMFLLKLEFL